MHISLRARTGELVRAAVARGEFQSVEEAIEQALRCFFDESPAELDEVRSAVSEALAEEGSEPAEAVFAELRARHGLPR